MIRTDFPMFVKNLFSKSFTPKYFFEIGCVKETPQRSIENSSQSVFGDCRESLEFRVAGL